MNKWLAVDSTRSSGVPLNPQFRNPPPAANDPTAYDDPVTIPAGDIAENPYWKRDVRRMYARPSAVTQGDVVALLSVGSKASPKQELVGDAGTKQLVAVKEEGGKGLAPFLEKETSAAAAVLGADGLPPMPPAFGYAPAKGYRLLEDQTYGDK
ncbi:MAG: hypothetical protein INR71_00250 [Terriglobus roseus]|nr:hypothetical protein [Terriglobus roseus]